MRTNGSLRMSTLAVVVLTVGALSACGSSGDEPDAAPSVTAVPSADTSPSPCWGKGSDTPLPSSDPEAELYVGLSEQDALDLAEERQQMVRVAGRDGECFAMTTDYQPERVNLFVQSDQVVAATLG